MSEHEGQGGGEVEDAPVVVEEAPAVEVAPVVEETPAPEAEKKAPKKTEEAKKPHWSTDGTAKVN